MVGRSVGWLAGWLAGSLLGRLVGLDGFCFWLLFSSNSAKVFYIAGSFMAFLSHRLSNMGRSGQVFGEWLKLHNLDQRRLARQVCDLSPSAP